MPTASPNPFDGWAPSECADWLAKQHEAEVAAVTDDDLLELFDAEILVSAFGAATLDMAKAWDEGKHKRDKGGKFSTIEGKAIALVEGNGKAVQSHTTKKKPTIGDTHAAAHGITGQHGIDVKSKRVRKYDGHDSVESFVAGHKRGRAAALREIAADHKAGRIGFKAPGAKAAPKLQPLTGGKTLTGDHVIASAKDNSLFSYAGVKDGDTLDQAAAKIAAKGHGPGVTAAAFAQAHQAGKITTAAGGKAVPVPLSASATAIIPKRQSAKPAPAKAETSAADGPTDASAWTKVGEQKGSNAGGTFQAPDGKKYYVKQAASKAHVENELLANELYAKLGAGTLGPKAMTLGGKAAIGSEIQSFGKFDPKDISHVAAAQKHFAAHAFLANHDAVGLTYDNVGMKGGEALMLDGGGALKYRAQGALKVKFDGSVDELNSLRDASVNPQAAAVFGKMTPAQIKASAAPVLALSDKDIDAAVAKHITDPKLAGEYAATLKARRDDLGKRVAVLDAPKASGVGSHAIDGGKTLPGDAKIKDVSVSAVLKDAGVKAGDTLDIAATKMAAKGYDPDVVSHVFTKTNNAGAIDGKAVVAPAAASPTAAKPTTSYPIKGGKKLSGDHVITDPKSNPGMAWSGVKAGDTLDQAAAKMKAQGYGSVTINGIINDVHADGKIAAPGGGKAKAAKPAKPSKLQEADAARAAKPQTEWKDDPARWAEAPVAPLNTPKLEFGKLKEWDEAGHFDALKNVRKAAGLSYLGSPDYEAVSCYTGSGSVEINRELRAGKSVPAAYTNVVKDLNKIASAQVTKADVIMYRGVNTSGVKTYGGLPNLNNMPPPASFDDGGFCSLSFNPGVSAGFSGTTSEGNRAIFRVRVPKGSRMANIGRKETSDLGLMDEAECILPRGSKFVYVGHQMIGGRKIIDVEHVPN